MQALLSSRPPPVQGNKVYVVLSVCGRVLVHLVHLFRSASRRGEEEELLHRHRRPQLYFHRVHHISSPSIVYLHAGLVFGLQAVSGLVADCCDYYLVVGALLAIRCARDEDGCGYGWDGG